MGLTYPSTSTRPALASDDSRNIRPYDSIALRPRTLKATGWQPAIRPAWEIRLRIENTTRSVYGLKEGRYKPCHFQGFAPECPSKPFLGRAFQMEQLWGKAIRKANIAPIRIASFSWTSAHIPVAAQLCLHIDNQNQPRFAGSITVMSLYRVKSLTLNVRMLPIP